jgi:hypothetical protein
MLIIPQPSTNAYGRGGIDEYTKLMLKFQGADGATTTVDDSPSKHAVTFLAGSEIDTAQNVLGEASSLYSSGVTSGVYVADHDDFNFGSGNFTLEAWIRFDASPTGNTRQFFRMANGSGGACNWFSNNSLSFQAGSTNTFNVGNLGAAWAASAGVWYHLAVVRSATSTVTLYVNGTSIGSTGTWGTMPDYTDVVQINGGAGNTSSQWMYGFRVSKGIARWTSNFTPPTRPYW